MFARWLPFLLFLMMLSQIVTVDAQARPRHRRIRQPKPTTSIHQSYSLFEDRQFPISPGRIELHDDGTAYLGTPNHRGIVKMDENWKPLQFYFAAIGAGANQRFAGDDGIYAAASDGKVYSIGKDKNPRYPDTNARYPETNATYLDVFEANGKLLNSYPVKDAIAIYLNSDDEIYLLLQNGDLNIYNPDMVLVRAFSVRGSEPNSVISTFVLDEDDNIYVINKTTAEILVFDPKGNLQLKFKAPAQWLTSLDIDSQKNIYVTSGDYNKVFVFSPKGKLLRSFGNESTSYKFNLNVADGYLKQPRGITIDDRDQLWIVDADGWRLQLFDSQGRFIRNYSNYGTADGELVGVRGFTLTPSGTFMVSDTENLRIQEFDQNGNFLRKFGDFKDQNILRGQMFGPWENAVDSLGQVYVTDPRYGQVRVYNADGSEKLRTSSAYDPKYANVSNGPAQPFGIALNSQSTMYVQSIMDAIYLFDRNGIYRGRVTDPSDKEGRWTSIKQYKIAANDDLYILKLGGNFQIFSPTGKWKKDFRLDAPVGAPPLRTRSFMFDKDENIISLDEVGILYLHNKDGKLKKAIGSPEPYKNPLRNAGFLQIDAASQKLYFFDTNRIIVMDRKRLE